MVDSTEIVTLTCLCVVIFFGTILNSTTAYVLLRDKILSKRLSSVRWLMFGEALCITIVCSIGLPLLSWNVVVGYNPDSIFSREHILCYFQEFTSYGMALVVVWYQTAIAFTRLAAFMMPAFYRQFVKRRSISLALFLAPWVLGYDGYIVGGITHAYGLYPTEGTGTCAPNVYDNSTEADNRFSAYLLSDAFLHSWIPAASGLLCYAAIYTKKAIDKLIRNKNLLTEPNAAVDINFKKRQQARNKKLNLLATVYFVNFCLMFPNTGIAWGLNYFVYLSENLPVIARLLDVMYFLSFPVNPIMYILVSADFRDAFRRLFKCGKQSVQIHPTVTTKVNTTTQ